MNIADLNTEIRAICDADSTSLTNATLLYRVNNAYEEIIGKLIAIDQRWVFGDSNYTATPTGLTTLVDNQIAYQFNSGYLNVLGVEIKDINGLWLKLKPITFDQIQKVEAQQEFFKTKGIPEFYEKREDFIHLYAPPDTTKVTGTNGMKIFFQRTADIFTSAQVTTGTKVPGFASPYHIILAYKAALPYCLSHKKDRVAYLNLEIARLERELIEFYSQRHRDERKIIRPKRISHR